MNRAKISVATLDQTFIDLIKKTDQRTLALWAADCAERVLHYFEEKYPEDDRPREAIEKCREWAQTGDLEASEIKKIALSSHAAARDVKGANAARSAARAAGQALGTAHVSDHAIFAAIYAAKAVQESGGSDDTEREWQHRQLLKLTELANVIS